MGRFCGKVGYVVTVDSGDGIWQEESIERKYYGDWLRLYGKYQSANQVNDNIVIGNRISIVADAFAYENFSHIRYVIIMGVKWKVNEAEIQRPRIILTLGGEYNG